MTIEMVSKASGIKSIQRGTVSADSTATISAVVMAKSFVSFLGWTSTAAGVAIDIDMVPKIELTNTTTITCDCSDPKAGHTANFEVIEFY